MPHCAIRTSDAKTTERKNKALMQLDCLKPTGSSTAAAQNSTLTCVRSRKAEGTLCQVNYDATKNCVIHLHAYIYGQQQNSIYVAVIPFIQCDCDWCQVCTSPLGSKTSSTPSSGQFARMPYIVGTAASGAAPLLRSSDSNAS